MKNIFKKNSIIITALAIMIVIAGYLSFTNRDTAKDKETINDSVATSGTDVTDADAQGEGYDLATGNTTTDTTDGTTNDTTTGTTVAPTNGATTDNTNGTDEELNTTTDTDDNNGAAENNATDELGKNDVSDADLLADANDVADNGELNLKDGTPGDAVLASASVDSGYFASVKLKREQNRAKSKADLLEIIESSKASNEAKKEATDNMISLNEIGDKENAAEMLLGAKGFDDSVVFIVDDSVDVVVNAASLSDQQLAIIEDIVKNETGIPVKNIDIIPTVASE